MEPLLKKCIYVHIIPPSPSGDSQVPQAKLENRGYEPQAQRMLLCSDRVIPGNMYLKDLFNPLNLWQTKWNNMSPGLNLAE